MLSNIDILSVIFRYVTLRQVISFKSVSTTFKKIIEELFKIDLNQLMKYLSVYNDSSECGYAPVIFCGRLVYSMDRQSGTYLHDYVDGKEYGRGGTCYRYFIKNDKVVKLNLRIPENLGRQYTILDGITHIVTRENNSIFIYEKHDTEILFNHSITAKIACVDEEKNNIIYVMPDDTIMLSDLKKFESVGKIMDEISIYCQMSENDGNHYIISKTLDGHIIIRYCYFNHMWKIFECKTTVLNLDFNNYRMACSINFGIIFLMGYHSDNIIYSIGLDKIIDRYGDENRYKSYRCYYDNDDDFLRGARIRYVCTSNSKNKKLDETNLDIEQPDHMRKYIDKFNKNTKMFKSYIKLLDFNEYVVVTQYDKRKSMQISRGDKLINCNK